MSADANLHPATTAAHRVAFHAVQFRVCSVSRLSRCLTTGSKDLIALTFRGGSRDVDADFQS